MRQEIGVTFDSNECKIYGVRKNPITLCLSNQQNKDSVLRTIQEKYPKIYDKLIDLGRCHINGYWVALDALLYHNIMGRIMRNGRYKRFIKHKGHDIDGLHFCCDIILIIMKIFRKNRIYYSKKWTYSVICEMTADEFINLLMAGKIPYKLVTRQESYVANMITKTEPFKADISEFADIYGRY